MATRFRRRAPAIGNRGCVASDQAIVSQIGLGESFFFFFPKGDTQKAISCTSSKVISSFQLASQNHVTWITNKGRFLKSLELAYWYVSTNTPRLLLPSKKKKKKKKKKKTENKKQKKIKTTADPGDHFDVSSFNTKNSEKFQKPDVAGCRVVSYSFSIEGLLKAQRIYQIPVAQRRL